MKNKGGLFVWYQHTRGGSYFTKSFFFFHPWLSPTAFFKFPKRVSWRSQNFSVCVMIKQKPPPGGVGPPSSRFQGDFPGSQRFQSPHQWLVGSSRSFQQPRLNAKAHCSPLKVPSPAYHVMVITWMIIIFGTAGLVICIIYRPNGPPSWLSGRWTICLPVKEVRVQSLGREDPLERKWQSTSVFLPGKSRGQRSLADYSASVAKESEATWQASTTTISTPVWLIVPASLEQEGVWGWKTDQIPTGPLGLGQWFFFKFLVFFFLIEV